MVAKSREMFAWLGTFYCCAVIAGVTVFRKTGKPGAIAPLLPLTFVTGYHGDMAYGTKMNRIKNEAENILMFERDLIEMPSGLPTISSLDMGRMATEETAKFKAVNKDFKLD